MYRQFPHRACCFESYRGAGKQTDVAEAAAPAKLTEANIDALYTVRGLFAMSSADGGADEAAVADKWLGGSNGDLWQDVADTLQKEHATDLVPTKVRAHASFDQVLVGKIPLEKFVGNLLADAAADAAAQLLRPAREDIVGAWTNIKWAKQIGLRNSVIEQHIRKRPFET